VCPSEVSDIEHSIWRAYQDRGVRVWGISSSDNPTDLAAFVEELGLSYPILHDIDGSAHENWLMETAFPSAAFPQDWIVGPDGTVVYGNNAYEPDEMTHILDSLLD
jgi:peroxiredoxin